MSASIPAGGVVDMGGGAGFSYYPIQFLGMAYTTGMGAGGEVGVYKKALTQLFQKVSAVLVSSYAFCK